MSNEIQLRPSYWASVSGGKDSLFMLKLITENPDRYPLDGVVHFDIGRDYPFINKVLDYIESECKKAGIRYFSIKPRSSWENLQDKYGYPTRRSRWCNTLKMDCNKQLDEFLHTLGCYVVNYVGLCADEEKRFKDERNITVIYPIADFGIQESFILEWAKNVPMFDGYYRIFRRCGCMGCPCSTMLELAYICYTQPDFYRKMMSDARYKEEHFHTSVFQSNPMYNADYIDLTIRNKWVPRLLEKMLKND